ncbi:hypothetical protein [Halovivax cerinus]|uniref:DUF2064 domain-containing protein n=1 Tax=Halovivax cerinus TaxID=1487865 RepID=A0ABD5NMG7_9EURY|nr:hypothetical protein [Halovivax cerinus]
MIVVVPVDPPWAECASSRLSIADQLDDSAVEALYEASVTDVLNTAHASGGQLLVNYRDGETLPETDRPDDPEAACRDLVEGALGSEEVRFERQVGSTHAARMGNTVTHLLEREDAASVCVVDPLAPLVRRSDVDGVPMKARRDAIVLGSDGAGDVYLAAFTDPIDFEDGFEFPALSTLADRAAATGLPIGFTPMVPRLTTVTGLAATIAGIDARRAAGDPIPESTATAIDRLELDAHVLRSEDSR